MIEILNHPAIMVSLEESNALLKADWTAESEKIDEFFFKQVNKTYLDAIQQYQPTFFLINAQHFLFTIAPAVQEWVAKNIIARALGSGIRKIAIVVSEEMVAQLSIEQTMTENQALSERLFSYFSSEKDAFQWLGIQP